MAGVAVLCGLLAVLALLCASAGATVNNDQSVLHDSRDVDDIAADISSGRQLLQSGASPVLSIRGVEIYNSLGTIASLKGIGWYGFNIPQYGNVWGNPNQGRDSITKDYGTNVWRMKQLGFNTIRMAFTFDILNRQSSLRPAKCQVASQRDVINSVLRPGVSYRAPKELPPTIKGGVCNSGMPSGRAWEQFVWAVKVAAQRGMWIILDFHSNKNGDSALYYPDYFIQQWTKLVSDIKKQPGTYGRILLDVVNEPDGYACTWQSCRGHGTLTNLYDKTFTALHRVCPECLLLAEGAGQAGAWSNYGDGFTTNPTKVKQLKTYLQNRGTPGYADASPFFRKIHNAAYRSKVILAPHVYCPQVTQAIDHFQGDELYSRLDWSFGDKQRRGFTYGSSTRRYPILNGEFGSTFRDTKEKSCMRDIARYMNNQQGSKYAHPKIINWAYWVWNADSSDTGGILAGDWRAIDWNKINYLETNLALKPWYRR